MSIFDYFSSQNRRERQIRKDFYASQPLNKLFNSVGEAFAPFVFGGLFIVAVLIVGAYFLGKHS